MSNSPLEQFEKIYLACELKLLPYNMYVYTVTEYRSDCVLSLIASFSKTHKNGLMLKCYEICNVQSKQPLHLSLSTSNLENCTSQGIYVMN